MIISSATRSAAGFSAVIDGVTILVPDDLKNRHRQALADWELAGNVIAPYEPEVAAPTIEEKLNALTQTLVDQSVIKQADLDANLKAATESRLTGGLTRA